MPLKSNLLACIPLMSVASLLVTGPSAAQQQPAAAPVRAPTRAVRVAPLPDSRGSLINLSLGVAVLHKTDRPFASIVVGDPKVIEVTAVTDRTVTLVPIAPGLTNVLFLDDKGDQAGDLRIFIPDDLPAENEPVKLTDPSRGRVRIHNKALVTSYTAYRCSPIACQYVDELTAKEPAPPPPQPPAQPSTTTIQYQGDYGTRFNLDGSTNSYRDGTTIIRRQNQ